MMDDLIQHYQDELTYLRSAGDFFAKNHPELARHLRMDSPHNADPFVGKLVESFAFLTARVKQELDNGYSEINDALLDIVLPHLTKPIPSLATVAIAPQAASHSLQHLPRHSDVVCRLEDGTLYSFKTVYDTDILPLKISHIQFENAPFSNDKIKHAMGAKSKLMLQIDVSHSEVKISELDLKKIRFYIHLEPDVAYRLYEMIFNHTLHIDVHVNPDQKISLSRENIQAVGFKSKDAALPYAKNSFEGYRLLTECFAYPQKFLYFDVLFDSPLASADQSLTLTMYFNEKNTRLDKVIDPKALQLNTVPLINLYDRKSEKIEIDPAQFEFSVLPLASSTEGAQAIYEICEVQPVSKEDPITFYPYFGLKHHAPQQKNGFYWHIRRRMSCEKTAHKTMNNNVQISFSSVEPQKILSEKQRLYAELRCFNTDVYQKMFEEHQTFTFTLAQAHYDKYETVEALGAITDIQTIPLGNTERWKIISHLAFHLNALFDENNSPEPLKEMLKMYEVGGDASHQQWIECLQKLVVKPGMSRVKVGKQYGFCTVLEIQAYLKDAYKKQAGIYFFGCVLREFLSLYVSVNQMVHFKMLDKTGELIYAWEPHLGS